MPSCQKLGETRSRIFRAFGVSVTPWYWTSGLLNSENEFLLFSTVRFMVTYLSSPRKWMLPYMKCCSKVSTAAAAQSLSRVWLLATPWTVARQAPLSTGILQERTLEWIAMPSSRGSSHPRDRCQVSCTAGNSLPSEPPGKPYTKPNFHQLLVQARTPKSSWQKQALLNDASKQLLCASLVGMSDFIRNSQRNEIFDTCWCFYSVSDMITSAYWTS